jgi:hypothetical protein
MDKIDQDWFTEFGRISCPNLTHLEYETIIDKLENASTRTLISFDEARTLLPNIDDSHIKTVYDFWNERRSSTRVYFLNLISLARFPQRKKIEFNSIQFREIEYINYFLSNLAIFWSHVFGFFFFFIKLIRTND